MVVSRARWSRPFSPPPADHMEGEVVTMQELFGFEQTGVDSDGRVLGKFKTTGIRPSFASKFEAAGVHLPSDLFSELAV